MLAQNEHSSNPQTVQPVEQLQACPHCGAAIRRMRHRITQEYAAIDMVHTPFGNVLINLSRGTYEELTPDERIVYRGWLLALHRNICRDVDKGQGR